MPWGWIVFRTPSTTVSGGGGAPGGGAGLIAGDTAVEDPTSWPPDLPSDPVELEAYVRDVVENAGAELLYLFFTVGTGDCHAIVKDLDNYKKAKAVADILHAKSYTKLLDSRLAKGAQGLEPRFRKRRPPPKA